MINVEDSIIIHHPVAEVFAFVADQTNAPQWQEGWLEVRRTTGEALGIGTKHTAVRKFLGQRLELTNEYTKYEPNKQISFKGNSGPMRFETSYLTEPVADGTKVTCQMLMEQGGLFALAEPLMAASPKRGFATNFQL
jgi:uncharacterized protein YndB with AHSA1/START domain